MSGSGHEAVSKVAQKLIESDWFVLTNSMLVSWIVTIAIILFFRLAMKKNELKPGKLQNFAEFILESIYNLFEGILGPKLNKKTFWFFSSLFVFIVVSNWSGLLPFTGNFTSVDTASQKVGLWRPGTADMNLTFAMAIIFMVLWLVWSIQEIGVVGFFKHIFAPKGKTSGAMAILMIVIFFAVGIIEVISISFRPISLSFRLFGNIYGGENVMHAMALPGVAIPFYFMEIMVGLIQGLVFALLSAVFLALMCSHDEEHGDEHHEGGH